MEQPPLGTNQPSPPAPFILKFFLYFVHLLLITHLVISLNLKGEQATLELYHLIRESVYKVYASFFLLIGFAIIFKKRLPPRLLLSIHSSLPLLILSLIFFTFSYSLALGAASLLNLL